MPDSLYERIGGRAKLLELLRHFYADVRQHRLIGPIFNQQIHDWPAHIEKIAEFWARVMGAPSNYTGQMPARHMPLGLQRIHLEAWLELWEFNCRRHLPAAEAAELTALAGQIGERLMLFVLGDQSLRPSGAKLFQRAPDKPLDS